MVLSACVLLADAAWNTEYVQDPSYGRANVNIQMSSNMNNISADARWISHHYAASPEPDYGYCTRAVHGNF